MLQREIHILIYIDKNNRKGRLNVQTIIYKTKYIVNILKVDDTFAGLKDAQLELLLSVYSMYLWYGEIYISQNEKIYVYVLEHTD